MLKNEGQSAILKDRQGRAVALKGVRVRARLHGLLAEVSVEQSYANPGQSNIEAVYTFPLPMGAVLLGLEVEIAGKKLAGHVVEKKQAERNYEEAVTDGNSAVMLEEAGPGLYTASLGNLMAGESAVIRYRYGLLLSWQGPRLRFLLPTTIAPRYGDALAAGLQPHQVPTTALDVEYPLDLEVTVEGELAAAAISSPSHRITCGRVDKGIVVRLSGAAVLDRDFVLVLESQAAQSTCILTPDGEGQVALASLRIPPVPKAESATLALKIVIDCSGSMAGVSIAQARKGAQEILNLLRHQDHFNVTLFGSQHRHLFKGMVPATEKYITEAWNQLGMLDANLGGTEMEQALEAVFALDCPESGATVLLITDGEIHAHEKLVKRAGASGHRVFTVGVGTAVSDTFLRSLAKTTGAACELVAPQEGMTERVLAQFHRMRQPRLGNPTIEWPSTPTWMTPLPKMVFAGDTVHVFAGFREPVAGSAALKVKGEAGMIEVAAPVVSADELEVPRLAAARRIESESKAEALRLALEYQLLTRWTNYLVIAERADKAADLPELHSIPQMLAAGWGGVGDLHIGASSRMCATADYFDANVVGIAAFATHPGHISPTPSTAEKLGHGLGRAVAGGVTSMAKMTRLLSKHLKPNAAPSGANAKSPAKFIESCCAAFDQSNQLPENIGELQPLGLDDAATKVLRQMLVDGQTEDRVVAAFLHALTESKLGEGLDRKFKRAVMKRWKDVAPGNALDASMRVVLARVTPEQWDWLPLANDISPAPNV